MDFESTSSTNSNTPAFVSSNPARKNHPLENGGTLRRDLNTTIHMKFSQGLAAQCVPLMEQEPAKWILSPSRLPIPSHRPVQELRSTPIIRPHPQKIKPFFTHPRRAATIPSPHFRSQNTKFPRFHPEILKTIPPFLLFSPTQQNFPCLRAPAIPRTAILPKKCGKTAEIGLPIGLCLC